MISNFPNKTLHEWKNPNTSLRINVHKIYKIGEIRDQFITYPRNLRIVWEYWKRVGFSQIVKKIQSRLRERERNCKIYGIGLGVVVEEASECSIEKGSEVLFFLYNHSEKDDLVCLDYRFVVKAESGTGLNISESLSNSTIKIPEELSSYIGWSPFSGVIPNKNLINVALTSLMGSIDIQFDSSKSISDITFSDRIEKNNEKELDKPSAVIFGLGNYAKTQIIPNIKGLLKLSCIHEIDPLQLGYLCKEDITLDTSPIPREDENYDCWFIAGYHHTHSSIAETAINRGGVAIIEKPLSTNMMEFNSFKSKLNSNSRFYLCFHKRYLPFNNYIYEDFNINKEDNPPIDMNCLVYEIPLPKLHWYNWINSGSRLISNGCHWIDHFMYLNSYSSVVESSVKKMRGSDLLVTLRLKNDATFVLSLTDSGSQRLGVRELLEIRHKDSLARIIDASKYTSENRFRILRNVSVNPLSVYSKMYGDIATSIVRNMPSDSIESLASSEICLKLEEYLNNQTYA